MKTTLFGLAIAAAIPMILPATPAAAQAVQNGRLILYGDDKCPTNADGEEIVVCVRRPEEERFRIPQELREPELSAENESWSERFRANQNAADTGIGSCSTVGIGGASGCFLESARRARAAREAEEDARRGVPLPD